MISKNVFSILITAYDNLIHRNAKYTGNGVHIVQRRKCLSSKPSIYTVRIFHSKVLAQFFYSNAICFSQSRNILSCCFHINYRILHLITLSFIDSCYYKLWRRDSNPRHMAYKATALTTELLHIDHLRNNSSQIQKHHISATDMWCYISNTFLHSDCICLYSTFYSTQTSPVFNCWIWDVCMLCNCVVKLKYNIVFAPSLLIILL